MIWKIHPDNPEKRIVQKIVKALNDGEIFILPTDTVYALVCSMDAPRAIAEIYKIKDMPESHHLSILCRDVAKASQYAKSISDPVFRFMKHHTPGPYTFIFSANRNMNRRGTGKRKTVGIRIVDHELIKILLEEFDRPLVASSLTVKDEYFTDPDELDRIYGHRVHAVVSGKIREHNFSTILDCSGDGITLIRQGRGDTAGLDLEEAGDDE
ncbi:MAG: L-threonylcarbamoyladenylate synthase [Spirochaetia bacterium]|nr:L-threonylcarbamoyladenylate synthase [Spirochaetia bacterium]